MSPVHLSLNDFVQLKSIEIPGECRSDHLVGVLSIFLGDLYGLNASSLGGCIGQKLAIATFLQRIEPENRLLDSSTHSQEAVVLQNSCLLASKGFDDI